MTEPARTPAGGAAALLDQGQTVDRLSRLLTAAALIGCWSVPACDRPAAVALAGIADRCRAGRAWSSSYFAMRVGFDAALFTGSPNAPGEPRPRRHSTQALHAAWA